MDMDQLYSEFETWWASQSRPMSSIDASILLHYTDVVTAMVATAELMDSEVSNIAVHLVKEVNFENRTLVIQTTLFYHVPT